MIGRLPRPIFVESLLHLEELGCGEPCPHRGTEIHCGVEAQDQELVRSQLAYQDTG